MHDELFAGSILQITGHFLCKTCTGLSVHGHFAMVTMLKDLHQQTALQVKSPVSTLIVAQSSRFLDSATLFLFAQQQAVTKPRIRFKWTSHLVIREVVSWWPSLLLT